MNLIILITVVTFAKGDKCCLSKKPPNGGSKFIWSTTGFRALSWLRLLSSSLPSHPPVFDSSQTLHPTPATSSPVFPSLQLRASLSSCLRETPPEALSAKALFGLPQGMVQFHLSEDRVAVAKVHLGKLVSPVVLWTEGQVTKVFRCQGEKEDVWVWDRRALETLRYFDLEKKLNMVNFDGKWYAWGVRRGEKTQQVGKGIFKMGSFCSRCKFLWKAWNLRGASSDPSSLFCMESLGIGRKKMGAKLLMTSTFGTRMLVQCWHFLRRNRLIEAFTIHLCFQIMVWSWCVTLTKYIL